MGNLVFVRSANGSRTNYAYNAANRLTTTTYPGSGGTVAFTYDLAGNMLTMVNPGVSVYDSYDQRNRVTNQTSYVSGVKYQTLYGYDKVGDTTSISYPDSYSYTLTYDGVNRLKKAGTYATVGYTVDDKIGKITYMNGEVTTYTYDNRNRPMRILDKYGSTKEMDLNYTYDATGNVKMLNTETYHYDWLNRLNYSSGPWTTITYSYDQVGNRVKMVQGTTTTYTYGSFNRLSSAGSTSYTYDANGNMITKSEGWTYSYDYENRLTKAVQSGTTLQQNTYDGNGNRIKQVAGSSTFTYLYLGLNILYEKNVTGSTTTVTKHFYAGGLQVAKMVGSTAFYLHQDALGSTRLVATSAVIIKFSSNYVPYGNNYGISGKEVFMYTGKPYDSATGLYYYGARYYDPTTGRFAAQDSYYGNKNDPMTMNRYIYARDNPERYIDPNGHAILAIATTTEGEAPRNWAAPLPFVPPLIDVNKVSTVPSPPSPSRGNLVRTADVVLSQIGKDQYTKTVIQTSTTVTQTTTTSTTTPPSNPNLNPVNCVTAPAGGAILSEGAGIFVFGSGAEFIGATAAFIGILSFGVAIPILLVAVSVAYYYYDPSCK
ncbi:MAG TPA: RHS repeat-associated core domain-containing protein [Nitrososphaerales archaeon]|nr:RHS repeat-associated core domain-containing protein [Nitrososphaerales archaeon]